MDILLLHFISLVWLSVGAASRWTDHPVDCFLAAGAIGWANLLSTALILSPAGRLGDSSAFLSYSLGIAALTGTLSWWRGTASRKHSQTKADHPLWFLTGYLSLAMIAVACTAAAAYLPIDGQVITYTLPRALLHVGEGSIFPLHVGNSRQLVLPFNHGLLQVAALVYHPSLLCLNFINLFGWVAAGVGLHRVCRLAGASPLAAFAAVWCALAATPVLALAEGNGNLLCGTAAFLIAVGFTLDWRQRRRTASAALAGLGAGLAAGTHPGFIAALVVILCYSMIRSRLPGLAYWSAALPCFLLGTFPFAIGFVLTLTQSPEGLLAALSMPSTEGPNLLPAVLIPLWVRPELLRAPTEHNISLGLSGLTCLVAGIIGAWHLYRSRPGIAGLALLSLLWALFAIVASRRLNFGSEMLVPAVLLAGPSLALLLDVFSVRRRLPLLLAGGTIGAGTLYSAQLYLWYNAERPLATLLTQGKVRPPASELSPELELRLRQPLLVNFITDTDQEPLLFMMQHHQRQRYTANPLVVSTAYNVISRSTAARDRTLYGLPPVGSFVWVPFPGKPSAGIEPLGLMEERAYFGISGQADMEPPVDGNQALLVTLVPVGQGQDPGRLRLSVMGLNPSDHARFNVLVEEISGERRQLASMNDGIPVTISPPSDYYRLLFQIVAKSNGREINLVGLPMHPPPVALNILAPPPLDPAVFFCAELVSSIVPSQLECTGLTPLEGPFPQWHLPCIRWARNSAVILKIPEFPGLSHLRLQLSTRTHIRPQAILEVIANGTLVRRLEFSDPAAWQELTFEIPARHGYNLIELRDVPLPPEPDWTDYLQRYPDVKRYVEREHQQLRQGAIDHYTYSGKAEGRTMHLLPVEPTAPDAYFFMFRSLRVEGLRQ